MAQLLCATLTQAHSSATVVCALKLKLFHSENCFEVLNCFFDPLGWKVLYQCITINDNKLFLRWWGCFASCGAKWPSAFLWVHPKCEIPWMSLAAGQPRVSSLCVHFALWKHCKKRLPEEEAHHTAGGTLPGGRTSASPVAHRQPLLGAACTNTLFERLAEVPARWLKRFHRLFFWDPFQFLWIGLLFAHLPRLVHGSAARPRPPLLTCAAWPGDCLGPTNGSLLQVVEGRMSHYAAYGEACFSLPYCCLFKYSRFIVLKDALCKGVFQKPEGRTVVNMCSGVSGAPLTKWALQRCISTRNNRNV